MGQPTLSRAVEVAGCVSARSAGINHAVRSPKIVPFREDFPEKDPSYGKFNIVIRRGPNGEMQVTREPLPDMREDLKRIIEENK